MAELKIGLVQMRCEKAAIAQNLEQISLVLADAERRGIDILCFPEMSITGYADPTRYPQAILSLDGAEMGDFLARTQGSAVTVLAGLIEANPQGKPFITQVAAQDGRLLGFYRKITIKDGEELWFSPGSGETPVFQRSGVPFGMAICADIGNPDVFAHCAEQGARIVFELAAPGLYGEQATRNWQSGFEWWRGECLTHLSRYAAQHSLWIGVATQAGRTIDEDFPGGGYLFSPDGQCRYETPDYAAGVVFLALDLERSRVKRLA